MTVAHGMVGYLVTDYGKMIVPHGVEFPSETLYPDAFRRWLLYQTLRAKHAWRVGRNMPKANDGGW